MMSMAVGRKQSQRDTARDVFSGVNLGCASIERSGVGRGRQA
jgi:hypothetical protein